MKLIVKSGEYSESYLLSYISIDAAQGIEFHCLREKDDKRVLIRPPRTIREGIGMLSYISIDMEEEGK